jgi:hypothetical protein
MSRGLEVGTSPVAPEEAHILCREQTLVKHHECGIFATPLCCRSWTCDYCRPERKARIRFQAQCGAPDTFITLTTNPARGTSPATRAAELVKAWRRFVRAAKKHYGYPSIPYFAVFEATKLGQPHLHILCRVKWIDQRYLSAFMKAEIGAPIVDIRRVRSPTIAARYISKYVGKAPGKFGSCKRYWQTKDYRKLYTDFPDTDGFKGPGWERRPITISDLLLHHTIQRHQVKKIGPIYKITTTGPPQ